MGEGGDPCAEGWAGLQFSGGRGGAWASSKYRERTWHREKASRAAEGPVPSRWFKLLSLSTPGATGAEAVSQSQALRLCGRNMEDACQGPCLARAGEELGACPARAWDAGTRACTKGGYSSWLVTVPFTGQGSWGQGQGEVCEELLWICLGHASCSVHRSMSR